MAVKCTRIVVLGGALAFSGVVLAQQQQLQPPLGSQQSQSTAGMSNGQVGVQQTQQQMQNLDPNQDTGSTGLSGPQMRDRNFLRTAYSEGLAEIQMAKLAAAKSSNAEVKAFAQMMLDDHATLNSQIETLAQETGVTLTQRIEKADQAEYAKLKDMAGDSFDKEYAVYMVISHRSAQREFYVEASVADEANGLKQHVAQGLITIRKHTQTAQKLVGEVGATMPPRPAPPAK